MHYSRSALSHENGQWFYQIPLSSTATGTIEAMRLSWFENFHRVARIVIAIVTVYIG